MKTITEYIPLIFSRIEEHAAEKAALRRRLKTDAALVTGYCLIGLWLCWDTGIAPWHLQFWGCFGPLFIAAELALRLVFRQPEEDCESES